MNITTQPRVINGDTVVGMTNTSGIKEFQWMDTSTLASWYKEDPEKNHLGLIELFSSMTETKMPQYYNFWKTGAVLNVNGYNGKFTYDLPVEKNVGCYTLEDTSTKYECAGIDGSTFEIGLDRRFTKGDVLTYDAMYGEQMVVSEDHEVRQEGTVFFHTVKLLSTDEVSFFPNDKLKKGIQYFKIGHLLGEYSTQFSAIQPPEARMGTVRCEFTLGNHRGVETFMTAYAASKDMSGATINSKEYADYFAKEAQKVGVDKYGKELDMFFTGKLNPKTNKINPRTVKTGTLIEYLVVLECMRLEAHQLMFQKAGFISDVHGTKRANEGIWHQWRRGRIIKYSRPNGITKDHIRDAAAYIFRANNIQPHERKLHFKCGTMAYRNFLQIFRDEFHFQREGLGDMLGTDRQLPSNPIVGKLDQLMIKPVVITGVYIPDVGNVTIEVDHALDYLPLTERYSAGYYGNGFAHTTWSAVMYDIADSKYSNGMTNLPSGTKLIEGSNNKSANVYYVKPEGQGMMWGYEAGRWSPDSTREIASSMKYMGREFWCHSASAAWVKDLSRYVVIELNR